MKGQQPTEHEAANLPLALQHLIEAMGILECAGLKVAVAHAQLAHDICEIEAAARQK